MTQTETKSAISGARILVADDHRNIRVSLRLSLDGEGAVVTEADTFQTTLEKLGDLGKASELPFDAVLLDIRMPDGNGLDILRQISERGFASRVIMITGEGTHKDAFLATKMGAFDYVEKPFTPERILVSVGRCLDYNSIQSANQDLKKQALKGQEILGSHTAIQELHTLIRRVGPTNGRVLIFGESGTGKELVAKALHRESERRLKPMIKVNCAAIPHSLMESELFGHEKGAFTGAIKGHKGMFEQADGGSLFLDEIGELSLDVQAKLLRVLQSGEFTKIGSERLVKVDVRVIAATHRDLDEMVQNHEFREDLFYRLNVINVRVPPLRERGEDITLLAKHFLEEAREEHSLGYRFFGERALKQIGEYHWPGNIRELRNLIERVAILSDEQLIDDIPELVQATKARLATNTAPKEAEFTASSSPRGEGDNVFRSESGVLPWQEFHYNLDRGYIKFVLNQAAGNVSEAARMLCLERAYLHRLMKKLGIQRGVVVTD